MSATKQPYETTCIINASLEDSQIEATITHISEIITRNGGEISATNRWGRKRLAYPIQKKNNGYYVNIEFVAHGQAIAQLERIYILDENILRYLTIQLDKKALQSRPSVPVSVNQTVPSTSEPVKAPLFEDEPTETAS
jgi:small subunit ribosomal protein S6